MIKKEITIKKAFNYGTGFLGKRIHFIANWGNKSATIKSYWCSRYDGSHTPCGERKHLAWSTSEDYKMKGMEHSDLVYVDITQDEIDMYMPEAIQLRKSVDKEDFKELVLTIIAAIKFLCILVGIVLTLWFISKMMGL